MKIINKLLVLVLSVTPFLSGCKNKEENLIKISEVTHSLFYAPLYIAKEKGFFLNEGINVDIQTSQGSDKVMASLLSRNSDVGLMGNSIKRWKIHI